MNFEDLLRVYGPLLAIILTAIASVWGAIKLAMPRLLDSFIAERQAKREQDTELAWSERQDDIALLTQVINLTNQVISQNKALIAFITDDLRNDVRQLRDEIRSELQDIDQRWLAASRQMEGHKAQAHILSIEIARLSDNYVKMEERITSLVAFGLEREDIGKANKAGNERGSG